MSAKAVQLTQIDIDNALNKAHLDVVFQPIISLRDHKILRHEVFVRWDHPGIGPLAPGAFLAFFEAEGRSHDLTRYVLREAIKAYCAAGDSVSGGLSINLSVADLRNPELPLDIKDALDDAPFGADELVLECPCVSPELPADEAPALYARLAKTGCPLALEIRSRTSDDLAEIDPFPFAEIKTGGSHILRYARASRGGLGMSAMAELLTFAEKRGARVVAVGIENQATANALAAVGFDAGQGRALGKVSPLAPALVELDPVEPPAPVAAPQEDASTQVEDYTALSTNAQTVRKARIIASKRMAAKRLHAANTARYLQRRLENDFSAPPKDQPETAEEKHNNSADLTANAQITDQITDHTPTNHDIASAEDAAIGPVQTIIAELPTEIVERAPILEAQNIQLPQAFTENAATPEPATDLDNPAPVTANEKLEKPSKRAVIMAVPETSRRFIMPLVLRRKYRITHFWPRSWAREKQPLAQAAA